MNFWYPHLTDEEWVLEMKTKYKHLDFLITSASPEKDVSALKAEKDLIRTNWCSRSSRAPRCAKCGFIVCIETMRCLKLSCLRGTR
jgi:hypothetical protein